MRHNSCAAIASAIGAVIEVFVAESLAAFERVIVTVKRSSRPLIAASVLGLLGAGTSRAAVVLSDNFDSYADQAAFQAAWPAIGTVSPTSAVLQSTTFVSASNAIQVPGTATSGQNRNRRSFTETTNFASSGNLGIGDQLIWSFDFYDSNSTVSPYRNSSNLQDSTGPSATNQLISMGMNNNQTSTQSGGNYYMARILGYDPIAVADPDGPAESVGGAGAYFKLNDFGVGLRSTGWHNLKVIISTNDSLSTDYAFYVDNALAETVNNVGTAASIRSYDNITLGSGVSNAGNESDFDNVSLQMVVPEPASLGLLGLGALVALRRRVR